MAHGLEGGGPAVPSLLPGGEAGAITLVSGNLSPTLCHSSLHREVLMAFGARAEHPNISHRPQPSVSEEFSAPLELSQPLSGLVDGSTSYPFPAFPALTPPMGSTCPREGTRVQPQGLVIPNSTCSGVTSVGSKPDSPSHTYPLLS